MSIAARCISCIICWFTLTCSAKVTARTSTLCADSTCKWRIEGIMTIIPNWLRQRAYLSPDKVAIIAGSERWTFRELDTQADRAARRLITLGAHQDSRVALLMRNGAPFVTLAHAISKIGAALVPLHTRLTAAEIALQLTDVGASCLIYDQANAATAQPAAHDIPSLASIHLDPFNRL